MVVSDPTYCVGKILAAEFGICPLCVPGRVQESPGIALAWSEMSLQDRFEISKLTLKLGEATGLCGLKWTDNKTTRDLLSNCILQRALRPLTASAIGKSLGLSCEKTTSWAFRMQRRRSDLPLQGPTARGNAAIRGAIFQWTRAAVAERNPIATLRPRCF